MVASTDTSNEGRMSTGQRLERIETKIDHLIEVTGALTTQAQVNKQRIGGHDSDLHDMIITIREEIRCREAEDAKLDERMDGIEEKSNTWDKINTGLATAAGVVGSIFGVRS